MANWRVREPELVPNRAAEPLQARGYRVTEEAYCRPSIGELVSRLWDGLAVVKLRRRFAHEERPS